jgi:di/tricarboxylate transporter
VNWKSVFLMACLIPLGWAVDATGAGAWMAQEVLRALAHPSVWQLQLAVAVLTMLFGMVMSNVGATVVMVPLAINIALATGARPAAFAMLVALSASNNFVTASNPVVAMIAGPGGYRRREIWKVGGLISLGYLIIIMIGVNLMF